MSPRHRTDTWLRGRLAGFLLAVVALASQLALGAMVLPDEASAREQSTAALEAMTVLCDSSVPAAPDHGPAHHRHVADSALCPFSAMGSLQAAVLASAPDLPLPVSRLAARAGLPPLARGPPAPSRRAPPPRGPPVLG